MEKIAISGAAPPEKTHGLATPAIVKDLLEHPNRPILVVGLAVNAKTITNNRKGTQYPVVGFMHWEAITDALPKQLREAVVEALIAAQEARTGQRVLPFPPADEVPLDENASDDPEDETA
jgi:hypothetical protein